MQAYPHHYKVSAAAAADGDVTLTADSVSPIASAPPPEFGGPGDRWSPESLLVAAVADCFVLTLRAIAKASRLTWTSVHCHVEGTLDRADGVTRFTQFVVNATLEIPDADDEAKAKRLMEKSEENCLITNSLSAEVHLNATVNVG